MPTKVALYVTCLLNSLRPHAAYAAARLIKSLGYEVEVPIAQTCCGQPGYNNGHQQQAVAVVHHQIRVLEGFSQVVVPSGSCCAMIRNHYPALLSKDSHWQQRAVALSNKVTELSEFLLQHDWQPRADAQPPAGIWAHHTSCSCLRDNRSHQATETLLQRCGVQPKPFIDQQSCCGFGGTFASKFTRISRRMGENKLNHLVEAGVNNLVSADYGCLMQLSGVAATNGHGLQFHHIAEVLHGQS